MESGYLRRLGLPGAPRDWHPDRDDAGQLLRALAVAHHAAVPFENLAIHAGEPVRADPEAIVAKIVDRRRGGICYELNGGFGWLLERLGWTVDYHGGRVVTSRGPGLPLGHLALVVDVGAAEVDGTHRRWLVDVGFGGDMVIGPVGQTAPGLLDLGAHEVGVRQPSGEVVDYLLETRSRPLADFAGMAWWHSTSPESRFTGALICSVTRDGIRHTLSGRRFKVTEVTGARKVLAERLLEPSEVMAVYRRTYGMELATEPVAFDFSGTAGDQRQSVANGSPR